MIREFIVFIIYYYSKWVWGFSLGIGFRVFMFFSFSGRGKRMEFLGNVVFLVKINFFGEILFYKGGNIELYSRVIRFNFGGSENI